MSGSDDIVIPYRNGQVELSTERCLVLTDVHQNLVWVESVLEAEEDNWTHLLLNGDYFDANQPREAAGPAETASFLQELRDRYDGRITFHIGNHDAPYIEAKHKHERGEDYHKVKNSCNGYRHHFVPKIAPLLGWDFWGECRLFTLVNGWLVSHAGVCSKFWKPFEDPTESLRELEATSRQALERLPVQQSPILDAGVVRGGTADIGGLIWLDWEHEFENTTPYNQLVGHTRSRDAREKDGSWCIDGTQSCYALVDADGEITIKPDPAGP